jgi:hypothetical protein
MGGVDVAVAVAERIGVPAAILVAGVVVIWRLGGLLVARLVESYQQRVAALEADRDHFRDRSERLDDGDRELCQSMIADIRRAATKGGESGGDE